MCPHHNESPMPFRERRERMRPNVKGFGEIYALANKMQGKVLIAS